MRALVSMPRSPIQHRAAEAEAAPQLVELRRRRGGIGGVAVEHLDRDGTAALVAEQAEDDLRLAVARVAALGEWAAVAL